MESRLRGLIVSGELAAGSRLPTRRELGQSLKVSPLTIQHALDGLSRDGFVKARGKLGTFVADRPPHLANLAIVFPSAPDGEGWLQFWTALANEANALGRRERRGINLVYGITGHADVEDFRRLVADVRLHRIAGMIFASNPFRLRDTPLVGQPGMPCVAVMDQDGRLPLVPAVSPDSDGMIERALAHFASCGCRRLAVLHAGQTERWERDLEARCARYGMVHHPYWRVGFRLETARWARNVTQLLMTAPAEQRPDALLVTDDHLVEHASLGLIDAGVRVPDDVKVIGHCNFPWLTPSVLPIRRLGFEAREVMARCVDSIDRQRRGEPVAASETISAAFEDELAF